MSTTIKYIIILSTTVILFLKYYPDDDGTECPLWKVLSSLSWLPTTTVVLHMYNNITPCKRTIDKILINAKKTMRQNETNCPYRRSVFNGVYFLFFVWIYFSPRELFGRHCTTLYYATDVVIVSRQTE